LKKEDKSGTQRYKVFVGFALKPPPKIVYGLSRKQYTNDIKDVG
jgi:hypothetical protein